jgi:hypothetical protein
VKSTSKPKINQPKGFLFTRRVIIEKVAGAPGFAHYVIAITAIPASAPLRSLTRPSMAALLTLSQRSLRFESWLMQLFSN